MPEVQCPVGTLVASVDDATAVPSGVEGWWDWVLTGTLANATDAAVSVAESNIPDVVALDTDGSGRQVWSLRYGSYDIAVPAGQPRPIEVRLGPGEALRFRAAERLYLGPERVGSWVVDNHAVPADLMPVWVDDDLWQCGHPGGWY
ncbi:hypothetical protein [Georgenia sp. SUBG003]|uniref:hypothetical protein n=1 Tax=Georgenia sp. SUBG003 TaxID=1497974 RepID=UPI003AB7BCD2